MMSTTACISPRGLWFVIIPIVFQFKFVTNSICPDFWQQLVSTKIWYHIDGLSSIKCYKLSQT